MRASASCTTCASSTSTSRCGAGGDSRGRPLLVGMGDTRVRGGGGCLQAPKWGALCAGPEPCRARGQCVPDTGQPWEGCLRVSTVVRVGRRTHGLPDPHAGDVPSQRWGNGLPVPTAREHPLCCCYRAYGEDHRLWAGSKVPSSPRLGSIPSPCLPPTLRPHEPLRCWDTRDPLWAPALATAASPGSPWLAREGWGEQCLPGGGQGCGGAACPPPADSPALAAGTTPRRS